MQNLTALLTGKSRSHLVSLPNSLSPQHALQAPAVKAFLSLQKAAKQAGFNLQAASSFRDFARQQWIWNRKFSGERKVHDHAGNPLLLSELNDWEKCQAILRWSAVAGGSRHHWGTEVDIFDPDLLPQHQPLMLEPWEYQGDGYFAELTAWLQQYAEAFDFYFPFSANHSKQIGFEPWHLSFRPLADHYQRQFNAETLLFAWQNEEIAGKATLIAHLDQLFEHYIL